MTNEFELKGKENHKIVAPDGDIIKFYHTKNDLSDIDTFEHFIKQTEARVRTDPRYDNFIAQIKGSGYNFDVFQSGIDNNKFPNTAIEFHHGPIFSLFDICSIVADHMLANGEKITTFSVAREVLNAHELGLIQGVMLTTTNHQLTHDGKMFVSFDQTIGDLMGFIKCYKCGFKRDNLFAIEEYFKLGAQSDATDNDYLVLRNAAQKIAKYIDKY